MKRQTESIEERLDRLQARLRLLLAFVLMGLAALLIGAVANPTTVTARSIQIVSDTGAVLAELGVRDGKAGLYLDDESGQARVSLFHASDASGLYIMDTSGNTRIGVAQFAHGGGGVALHGADSRGAAVLYLKDEGSLRFYDTAGRVTNEVLAQGRAPSD
jgi:hypothetical protein